MKCSTFSNKILLFIAFHLLMHTSVSAAISYKPPLVPVTVSIDSNGKLSVSASKTAVTPIGSFTFDTDLSALSDYQGTLVIIRDLSEGLAHAFRVAAKNISFVQSYRLSHSEKEGQIEINIRLDEEAAYLRRTGFAEQQNQLYYNLLGMGEDASCDKLDNAMKQCISDIRNGYNGNLTKYVTICAYLHRAHIDYDPVMLPKYLINGANYNRCYQQKEIRFADFIYAARRVEQTKEYELFVEVAWILSDTGDLNSTNQAKRMLRSLMRQKQVVSEERLQQAQYLLDLIEYTVQ